jgi:putative hemolysin
MVEGDPGAGILLFLLLILTDMFFYGFSAALMALNSKEMEKRAQEDADKKAAKLLKIIDKPAKYIDTVQVVVSFVNIILGAVFIGNVFKGTYTVISCVVLLYLLLAFGVLLPKRIASRIPEKWAYAFINPMSVIKTLLYPMTALVSVTVKAVLYVFGIRDNADENDVTEEEIIDMVHEGHEQ